MCMHTRQEQHKQNSRSGWHSIFCCDWHNGSCSGALVEKRRNDMADLYCPCFEDWGLRRKLLGRDQHRKAASTVPGMKSSRLSDPRWPGIAASRRVSTERIKSLAKGPVSVGLPSKTSQPEGLYASLSPDATKQDQQEFPKHLLY